MTEASPLSLRYPAIFVPAQHRWIVLPTEGTFLVGRDSRCDLEVPDDRTSREQLRLDRGADGTTLVPLSRRISTRVNGREIDYSLDLSHGDEVSFGMSRFLYLERADPGLPPPPVHADSPARATRLAPNEARGSIQLGEEIPLERSARIGRAPPAAEDIVLDHPLVSRVHAVITRRGDRFDVHDAGSLNGTFLNGIRIHRIPVRLEARDRVEIGPYSLLFTGSGLAPSSRKANLGLEAIGLTRLVPGTRERLLDDVSLTIAPRTFVAILGASGSGKSTLLKALSAREPADSGRVLMNDLDLYARFDSVRRDVAVVPQHDVLPRLLSLDEALSFTASLRLPADTPPFEARARVEKALGAVGLIDRAGQQVARLSGGELRRASLANELIADPSLLFLDEVTSGLDEASDREIMALLHRLARDGKTVIAVTHVLTHVEEFCDQVVVLARHGRLAFVGSPAGAMEAFALDRLGQIYRSLEDPSAPRPVGSNSAGLDHSQPERQAPVRDPVPAMQPDVLVAQLREALRQTGILVRRNIAILVRDRAALTIAAIQAVVVAALLALTFTDMAPRSPDESTLLFLLGIASFFFGCNNAAKEIVKEQALYRAERDAGLVAAAHLASKLAVSLGVGLVQVALVYIIALRTSGIPGSNGWQLAQMVATVTNGTCVGLLISAASRTRDQANTALPLAVIPQIILSGVLVAKLPDSARVLARFATSGYWMHEGMMAVVRNDRGETIRALWAQLTQAGFFAALAYVAVSLRNTRTLAVWGSALASWRKTALRALATATGPR